MQRISAGNRGKKWSLFLSQFSPSPETLVLDVGFCDIEYAPTDNYIENHYPYPKRLTALGIEMPQEFASRYPDVAVICYDGVRFPFPDKHFDVCWSNAVLEHVGGAVEQVRFLQEIKRVSREAFVTTPNRFFPVEVHTRTPLLHYLPKKIFDRYLGLARKMWAADDYMHLLSESELRTRLSQADIADYRLVKNRLFGFTIDFAVIIDCG